MKVIKAIREIHRGGFGIIDEVIIEDGTHLARKTFYPMMVDKMDEKTISDLRRRFSREVRIQEKLPEDFFIPILYSNVSDENPWFLMPIADKVYDVEIEEFRKRGTHPDGLADILNALEYLHELGYVHRDLKPGNILYHEEKWKLADLGLITSDPTLTTSFKTGTGFGAGSALYMAPEQHTNFNSVTHHADIYSFGAILHDIFNGGKRVPHEQLSGKGKLGVIIEKCTVTDIKRRFTNVSSLRSVLLSHLSKLEASDVITEDAENWLETMNGSEWNEEILDSFIIYLENNDESHDVLFRNITKEFIESTFLIDEVYWKRLMLLYLEWINNSSFIFNYCDVLIGNILRIFNLTDDLEIKSNCALSGAELGRAHNRWYVMRFVLKMADSNIPNNLAERIAIELHVYGKRAKDNFIACAKQINEHISKYHDIIHEVLVE